ncbi:MAG: pilus assembly protein [Sphingobium sp.]|nr:pilus assembly protein [Sphingobium sp.]
MIRGFRAFATRLRGDAGGLAAVEFALSAPIVLTIFLSGAELTNYAITRMRVSQIALHIVDNASRIGTDTALSVKQISETQINDLFIGANLQAGTLGLQSRGKVILYSLEADASNAGKFYVHWQRCYGNKVYAASQNQGANNLSYIGPTGRQVTSVTTGTAVMYVEVAYNYKPLISSRLVPNTVLTDSAAMIVRDDRDLAGDDTHTTGGSGVYNAAHATASVCT